MHTIEWGVLVVNYLYLAGISAGAFAISSLATYLGLEKYEALARLGAYVAPFPVIVGVSMLLLDLGRPLAFYHLFTTVQLTSPMSIGTWLLTFFISISLVYFFLWLPAKWRDKIKFPVPGKSLFRYSEWRSLRMPVIRQAQRIFAALGFPISLGVGIYTGILLGAISARPFWNTPMVAQLFLFSALSSGTAAVIFVCCVTQSRTDRPTFLAEKQLILSLDFVFITLEIFMIIPFILHSSLSTWSAAKSLHLILGGPYTVTFWLGVVILGLLVPLVIEVIELMPLTLRRGEVHHNRFVTLVVVALILVGGFLLRYVFVYAGQVSHFLPE